MFFKGKEVVDDEEYDDDNEDSQNEVDWLVTATQITNSMLFHSIKSAKIRHDY